MYHRAGPLGNAHRSEEEYYSGSSYPLGVTVLPGGVNFSIFSRGALDIERLLFDRVDDAQPAQVIRIDPAENRTYHYWHTFVAGIGPGQIYGFRVNRISAQSTSNSSKKMCGCSTWCRIPACPIPNGMLLQLDTAEDPRPRVLHPKRYAKGGPWKDLRENKSSG